MLHATLCASKSQSPVLCIHSQDWATPLVLTHSLNISRHVKEKNPTILHRMYMIYESEMSCEGGGGTTQTPENAQGYNIAKDGVGSADREQPE